MQKTLIAACIGLLIAGGVFYFYQKMTTQVSDAVNSQGNQPVETATTSSAATSTIQAGPMSTIIGTSTAGHPIVAYTFGTGTKKILFAGGIHGGYEWNTVLVARQLVDYLKTNPSVIPASVQVTVVPLLNPDGMSKVVPNIDSFTATDINPTQSVQVAGRFNGNTVDLNRNFDCDWKAKGTWQKTTVSGGTKAFSETESQAVKSFVESLHPNAVVVWYSSAGGVFSSNCHDGVLPETKTLTTTFANASGYPAHEVFNYYEITGDMVNWLAKMKIPAISVLLTNHTDTEWDKNKAGIDAILEYYR